MYNAKRDQELIRQTYNKFEKERFLCQCGDPKLPGKAFCSACEEKYKRS